MAASRETDPAPRMSAADLQQRGRLHWMHWAVISLSLVLTLTASYFTRIEIKAKVDARFERQSEQAVSLVIERMAKYEGSLWGGVSAMQATGGDMTHPQWLDFAEAMNIDDRYPGINGIGVIHEVQPAELDDYLADQRSFRPDYAIHPEHDEDVFLPISYIEPAETNAAAVGLDMAHEANRFDGVLRARDSGAAQITGPIVLVQDSNQTPGFLFFAPWYEGNDTSPANRAETFAGVVYAPFVVSELMSGALDETQREIGIRILDGDEILFDEHTPDTPGFDPDPLLRQVVTVPFYGREWSFDIWTDQAFRESAANSEPLIILLGGLFIDALLLALFTSMARSRRNAHELASELTGELRVKTERLEESNAELERFAYVASHDLKTPLRGIASLTEFLEDDLDDYLASPDANPDVANNLGRLTKQTERMEGLIKGILDYARLGGIDFGEVQTFDLDRALDTIAHDLGLSPEQAILQGPANFDVRAGVYLEQVLQNLMANSVNHHHEGRRHVRIDVTVRTLGDQIQITVTDNGPGIDPRHHGRIFEIFQQLDADDQGTGIGLAIVKRIVENHGGSISVSSIPGSGATFTFTWPGTAAETPLNHNRELVTAGKGES